MHYFVVILFLALALIIVLIILRNTKTRHRLQKEKSEKELELTKAKLKHDYDKKLLDDFAQRILDKNKLITDLEQKIKSFPGFNSSAETAKKSLEELAKLKILTKDDWNKFQMNYNKVFPGSIKKTVTAFSDLTESELRMFLLIKLGIRIREVASVLGISQESVRKTRYRMRKKLNIGEEDDLDEFVKKFSGSDDPEVKVL
ncbi:MAG TPA: hypothetical protein VI757_11595 [Bacteroidia bacterium]|nr:hypothetical protein [Bacteroidia bacterium]